MGPLNFSVDIVMCRLGSAWKLPVLSRRRLWYCIHLKNYATKIDLWINLRCLRFYGIRSSRYFRPNGEAPAYYQALKNSWVKFINKYVFRGLSCKGKMVNSETRLCVPRISTSTVRSRCAALLVFPSELASEKYTHFRMNRIPGIGWANAGKTSLLQRVCNKNETKACI